MKTINLPTIHSIGDKSSSPRRRQTTMVKSNSKNNILGAENSQNLNVNSPTRIRKTLFHQPSSANLAAKMTPGGPTSNLDLLTSNKNGKNGTLGSASARKLGKLQSSIFNSKNVSRRGSITSRRKGFEASNSASIKTKKKLQNILLPTALFKKSEKNQKPKSKFNLDNVDIAMDIGGLMLSTLNPGSPRLAQMGMLFLPGEN